jgi:hypothetical protein
MVSHPKSVGHLVGRPAILLALLSLLVLLPYPFLPLVYYSYFDESCLSAFSETPQAPPGVSASQPVKPLSPDDCDDSPICQDSSDFQDCGLFSLPRIPFCAYPVRVAALISQPSTIGSGGFMVAGTRAPPSSL